MSCETCTHFVGSALRWVNRVTSEPSCIHAPNIGDRSFACRLSTTDQIVQLRAFGPDWWVVDDNDRTVRSAAAGFTPVFGNSVPNDLSFTGGQVVPGAEVQYLGKMMFVTADIAVTPTWTTASTGVWQISRLPAFRNLSGMALECRLSDDFSLPTGGDDFVLVARSAPPCADRRIGRESGNRWEQVVAGENGGLSGG